MHLMLNTQVDAPPCPLCRGGNLCEVMALKVSSTDLRKSSSMVQRSATTLPFIIPHKELSGVVSKGLRGGHVNGARDVDKQRPIQRPGKWSFKTSLSERVKGACAP